MAIKKRFTKTVEVEWPRNTPPKVAVLLADIGILRYTLSLFVDDRLVEEKTGFVDEAGIACRVRAVLSGEGFIAKVNFTRNDVSVYWS